MHIHRFLRLSYLGNLSIISDLLLVHPLRFSITYLTLLCSAPMGDSQPAHNCGMWGQTTPGPDAVWSYVYPMGSVSRSWLRWTHGCVLGGGVHCHPSTAFPLSSLSQTILVFFLSGPLCGKKSLFFMCLITALLMERKICV